MEPNPHLHRRRARRVGGAVAACAGIMLLSAAAAGACAPPAKNTTRALLTSRHFGSGLVGTVGTVSASSFALVTPSGVSWTVSVAPSTTFSEAGKTATFASITSGERVKVAGSVTAANMISASKVVIVLVQLHGTVVSTGSGTFTVSDRDGLWRVVIESASTTYSKVPGMPPTTATAADVTAGVKVDVLGTVDANHTSLDAVSVRILLARIEGTVTSVVGSSIAITSNGAPVTVSTSSTTTFLAAGGTSSIGAVKVGAPILAFGVSNSPSSFSATLVVVPPVHHPVPLTKASVKDFRHDHALKHHHHHHHHHHR